MSKSSTTKSKTLTLPELFNEGQNCFQIPDYQRAYSWETPQRLDLIINIENILQPFDYNHFTKTIVAEEKEFKNGFAHFDIADGQQRLTSLIILISVLAQCDYLDKKLQVRFTIASCLGEKEFTVR